MWRHCEVVIIAALRRLQNGCRGHLYRIRVIGRWMSLLDPGHLVGLARGPEVYPAICRGLLIGGHGGCSPSSLRGEHCSTSDGFGSSEVC